MTFTFYIIIQTTFYKISYDKAMVAFLEIQITKITNRMLQAKYFQTLNINCKCDCVDRTY